MLLRYSTKDSTQFSFKSIGQQSSQENQYVAAKNLQFLSFSLKSFTIITECVHASLPFMQMGFFYHCSKTCFSTTDLVKYDKASPLWSTWPTPYKTLMLRKIWQLSRQKDMKRNERKPRRTVTELPAPAITHLLLQMLLSLWIAHLSSPQSY